MLLLLFNPPEESGIRNLYVKRGSNWLNAVVPFLNVDGTWIEPSKVYTKKDGNWVEIWSP